MKKILLPTDFSENSWNAIVYALKFFKNEKCEFYILHTYTPTFYRVDYMIGGPTFSAIPDLGIEVAQAGLEKTVSDIKNNFDNRKHTFKTLSAFNTLVNEIIELIETKDFDLIVMGTQGATGAKEIFLGTHTVHVIRKSNIPVLVIPVGFVFQKIQTILLPSDYQNRFKKEDLQFLVDVIRMHKAKLRVLIVQDDHELSDEQIANQKSLTLYFGEQVLSFDQVKGKLIPNVVQEYADQNKSDLLTMMNRKHSFLERLIIQQNVDSIGFHTKIPFLVLRDTAEIKRKK